MSILFPMPRRAAGGLSTPVLSLEEREALREIVSGADMLEVDGVRYLLAPVSARTLDALAAFEAESEDLEESEDAEEDNEDCCFAHDDDPRFVANDWRAGDPDDAEDNADHEDVDTDEREPDHAHAPAVDYGSHHDQRVALCPWQGRVRVA